MVDVSDGLVADLEHVALSSGVGIELDTARLEVPAKLRDVGGALGVEPLSWVLAGGDDHALAATFPGTRPPPAPWRVIGRVARGRGVLVDGTAYAAARRLGPLPHAHVGWAAWQRPRPGC